MTKESSCFHSPHLNPHHPNSAHCAARPSRFHSVGAWFNPPSLGHPLLLSQLQDSDCWYSHRASSNNCWQCVLLPGSTCEQNMPVFLSDVENIKLISDCWDWGELKIPQLHSLAASPLVNSQSQHEPSLITGAGGFHTTTVQLVWFECRFYNTVITFCASDVSNQCYWHDVWIFGNEKSFFYICVKQIMTGIILQVTPLTLGFVGIILLPDPFTIYPRAGSASRRQNRLKYTW